MTSPAMPYGMVGPTPTVSPYVASSSGSLAGVPVDFNGHPGHTSSHLYSSEPHVQSGYYDRIHPYGGYGLQQYYQPAYYPQ
ncbi:hypothetical protein L6164_029482 [Bauhinia variegata]|nr:hypothetical protein L6164_029482 [Bauhinia variegata]